MHFIFCFLLCYYNVGAEGYAGSAIQIAILSDICASYNAEEMRHRHPTLVFVHALNPYGFANNRRVNEDNIDLNRYLFMCTYSIYIIAVHIKYFYYISILYHIRNFLTQKEFEFVKSRDPNYAGSNTSLENDIISDIANA